MVAVMTFNDLAVWKKAHELVLEVYKITDKYPKHEIFGLSSQSRRCAVSVASNIVEGFKRKNKLDSLHFYNIAEGSLEELKYQLLLAKDLKYIKQEQYKELITLAEETGRLLFGWKKVQK